jgi:F-type H+-transporting ATPase subunit delta
MKKNAGQIVRRYASALFEASSESSEVEKMSKDAEGLAKVFSPEMLSFFVNPAVELVQKKSLLDELLISSEVSTVFLKFFHLLIDNKRFIFVSEVLKEFVKMADEKLGIARVDLVTSHLLSDSDCVEFTRALELALKKKIVMTQVVDPALRAGCVVKIGNTFIDASLQARLQSIKESLSQGV